MSIQTILPLDGATVTELSRRNGEPEWMTTLREQAVVLAGQLELPELEKTRLDRWTLSSFGKYKVSKPIQSAQELPDAAQLLLGEGLAGDLIVQRNSTAVYRHLSPELEAKGVIFTDLSTALEKHASLIQPYFMQLIKPNEHRLTALHAALWNGGVFLYVPRNVAIEVPLQGLFVSDDASATIAPHVLIVAEANSSVSYVENLLSTGREELVVNGVVEIFAKPGSHVRFATVHNFDSGVTDISYRRAVIENDAKVEWVVGELNNGNGVSDTTSLLKGNGSVSDIKAICVGTNDQKLNLTTRNVHFGKSSESDMLTRAVMRDEATAIINGVTKIEKGATGANGQQTEKVLMLSPKARGDANPILLIDEDDVKAGHAASVGQVNPDQIYYLMSRGISKEEAQRLIIYGFLAPIVSEIPISKVEEQLSQLVERKLGQ